MTAVHLVGLLLLDKPPTIQGRTTMNDATIIDITGRDTVTDLLSKGARELLQAAVEAERDAFLAAFSERRTKRWS